jgi:hypothetical protein
LDANRPRLFEFPYVGLHLIPIRNSLFSFNPLPKSEFFSNQREAPTASAMASGSLPEDG